MKKSIVQLIFLVSLIITAVLCHIVTIFIFSTSLIAILIFLYISKKFFEKVIYTCALTIILLMWFIFRPDFIHSTASFNIPMLPSVYISDTAQKRAPFFYVLLKYIKYDPISRPQTPLILVYPMSFQLGYDYSEDIYLGGFVVMIKNLGHKTVKINNIEWKIESNRREIGFSSPKNAILGMLEELDKKNLSNGKKKIEKSKLEMNLKEIEGKDKVLYPNDEVIFTYAPQLEAGREIEGSITLSIIVTYEFSNNGYAISMYKGEVKYNSKSNFTRKVYYFNEKEEIIKFKKRGHFHFCSTFPPHKFNDE